MAARRVESWRALFLVAAAGILPGGPTHPGGSGWISWLSILGALAHGAGAPLYGRLRRLAGAVRRGTEDRG